MNRHAATRSGASMLEKFGEPADYLQVAKTARSFLDVRLQMIDAAVKLGVALARETRQHAPERCAMNAIKILKRDVRLCNAAPHPRLKNRRSSRLMLSSTLLSSLRQHSSTV